MAKVPRFIPNPAWVPGPPPTVGVVSSRWRKKFRKYLHWLLKNGLEALHVPVAHSAVDTAASFVLPSTFIYPSPTTGMPLPAVTLTPTLTASETNILGQIVAALEGEGWRVSLTGPAGAKLIATP